VSYNDGQNSATGKVAYNNIKKLIRSQGIAKMKKDTITCILATSYNKLVIEDGALKVAFK